jgi:hypothetical protein
MGIRTFFSTTTPNSGARELTRGGSALAFRELGPTIETNPARKSGRTLRGLRGMVAFLGNLGSITSHSSDTIVVGGSWKATGQRESFQANGLVRFA